MSKKSYSAIMPKLKALNLSINDYEVITHPYDFAFEFSKGDGVVNVESVKVVLPKDVQKELRRFLSEEYIVEPRSCHQTAVRVGMQLEKYGVEVVDGYYVFLENEEIHNHTFCKYKDKYFDPTIEEVFGIEGIQQFQYFSERVFSPHEMYLYQNSCGYAAFGEFSGIYWLPTLRRHKDEVGIEESPFVMDEEGFLQSTAA